MTIEELYDEVLNQLLELRKENPNFTFWLRRKSEGLKKGYWFQGNETYISVGLVKASSGNLSTKSIALNFDIVNDKIQGYFIVESRNQSTLLDQFYNNLRQRLIQHEKKSYIYYKAFDSSQGVKSIISDFWNFYPEFIRQVKENNLENELLITESDFLKSLTKVQDLQTDTNQNNVENINNNNRMSLNQILYGPPGTGKTYHTIDKVVEICEPDKYQKEDHSENKKVFDTLINDGRVVFTTFHQSMAYEDFIEGIKPVVKQESDDNKELSYEIEPGIFMQIARKAEKLVHVENKTIDWENSKYFKMSIGGKGRPDIHDYCISNNVVGIGWGGEDDLSELKHIKTWEQYKSAYKAKFLETYEENKYHLQAAFLFNRMKIGDIVVITKGNHIIDAIGKLTSEYEFNDDNPTGFYHFRKVEWIVTGLNASPEKFIKKQISQQSIYEFYDQDIIRETFKEITSTANEVTKPYVLVIDEINRGNVSAIFGELITLLEEDKRIDEPNELKVTLPYSKDKFGVPSNLHIIGTMNTADRSVEALDTALRRRFSFEEMLPNPEVLKEEGENKTGKIDEIDLCDLLTIINQRIEILIDRDHTIGHAYFMKVRNTPELKKAFKNKIIPLLQEYFYGDYRKMEMVIGPDFFDSTLKSNDVKFAMDSDFEFDTKTYHIKDVSSDGFDIVKALNRLLNKNI